MQRGLGFEFRNNVSLMDFPDARRINLHQTILDPYEQVQVKLFDQNNFVKNHCNSIFLQTHHNFQVLLYERG